MISPFARNAIVLGVLSAVGPFSIDMYLPAFPTIARDLGVSVGEVQMSLTSFFAAVAMCQMIYGPVSDRIGRKRPLYFGLATFIAVSRPRSSSTRARARSSPAVTPAAVRSLPSVT